MNPLAAHYSRFRVGERLLLTGHSHQAWPDVAFEAQQRAWLDAAELVDDKWARAAEVAEEVRAGWRRLLNDPNAEIALGQNTHELVVRLLSALTRVIPTRPTSPTRLPSPAPSASHGGQARRVRLVTTTGEFHSIRRQLDRLAEEGVPVTKVPAHPAATLAERLAAVVDDEVACVLVSSVLFETAEIVPHLEALAAACRRYGTPLLIDAYHQLNVVPFDVHALGLADAFIVGGGYKYCQLGEGNCFLRLPPGCDLRPVITGWFSEFARLEKSGSDSLVEYGPGAARFAGATYDPTSHYRAAAVFAFHDKMGLTATRLREINRHHVSRLIERFEAFDVDPRRASIEPIDPERRAGFLAIRAADAAILVERLRVRGVHADSRGKRLRLGPAPYLSDPQLDAAADALGDCLQ